SGSTTTRNFSAASSTFTASRERSSPARRSTRSWKPSATPMATNERRGPMSKPLSTRVHEERLLWDLIKLIGYGGFYFHELFVRLKPLVDQYGARKVSVGLIEVASHVGWVTTLNPVA